MLFRYSYIVVCVVLLFSGTVVQAQLLSGPVQFGKNRVQYKDMHWKLVRSKNFDVYYYVGGLELANLAAKYAEEDFHSITEDLGFFPYSKTRLIIYNSSEDLLQSNIGLENEGTPDAGLTDFVKLKVEVPFTGSLEEFRKQIRYHIALNLMTVMMYGGSLKDVLQSSYLLNLAPWYLEGAAAYLAEGWSSDMDDRIRDLIFTKQVANPEQMAGPDARVVGQSIWNYVVNQYDKSYISNILNITRIVRDEKVSIATSTGVTYEQFIEGWLQYYQTMAQGVNIQYGALNSERVLVTTNNKSYVYNHPVLNPSGTKLAYTRNYRGKYHVLVKDLTTDKTKKVFSGGYRTHDQEVNWEQPVIRWASDDELAVVGYKAGEVTLWNLKVNAKKRQATPLDQFTQVLGFDYSHDGRYIVFSAVQREQSDLYLYNVQRRSMKRITNDLFDDLDPVFLTNSYDIAFSSNRYHDTLGDPGHYSRISDAFDIFLYRDNPLLERISTGTQRHIRPLSIHKDHLLFLSDQSGIFNIHRFNYADSTLWPVTRFSQHVQRYDMTASGQLVYRMRDNGKSELFYEEAFTAIQKKQLPLTPRAQQHNVYDPDRMYDHVQAADTLPVPDTMPSETDSLQLLAPPEDTVEAGYIDIYNYRFEGEKKPARVPQLVKKPARKDTAAPELVDAYINGPFDYRPMVSVNSATTAIMIDPLRGLGVLLQTSMSDMFVNHKLKLGIFGNADLRSSNFYAQYEYLKNRVDFGLRYDREVISALTDIVWHKYTLNKFTGEIAYPFSVKSRVALLPFFAHTHYNDLRVFGAEPDSRASYAGGRAEYVYDNTLVHAPNMLEGTRFKISTEVYQAIGQADRGFNRFDMDFRHYQKIHREIIFASRFSYGKFFGRAPKNYLLGGMYNALFASTDQTQEGNPLELNHREDNSDLLFIQYVTPMRGFEFNSAFGNNYMLFNFELRIPLFRYIHNGPLSSSFMNSFQIIAFTDIGTTWSGNALLPLDNNRATEPINAPPFTGTVEYYTQPFISGHGFGVRANLLGYYVKFDVGWGLQDYQLQPPRFYLTFGHDF